MRIRLVSDKGKKPFAVIVEGPSGEQITKRDYQSREAAEKGRKRIAQGLTLEAEEADDG